MHVCIYKKLELSRRCGDWWTNKIFKLDNRVENIRHTKINIYLFFSRSFLFCSISNVRFHVISSTTPAYVSINTYEKVFFFVHLKRAQYRLDKKLSSYMHVYGVVTAACFDIHILIFDLNQFPICAREQGEKCLINISDTYTYLVGEGYNKYSMEIKWIFSTKLCCAQT